MIAAQSIGETGTQLTLRTFHVGGVASNIAAVSSTTSRYNGVLEIDELRTVRTDEVDAKGRNVEVVIGRMAEMRIVDPTTKMMLTSANIPYGAKLYFGPGDEVSKGGGVRTALTPPPTFFRSLCARVSTFALRPSSC